MKRGARIVNKKRRRVGIPAPLHFAVTTTKRRSEAEYSGETNRSRRLVMRPGRGGTEVRPRSRAGGPARELAPRGVADIDLLLGVEEVEALEPESGFGSAVDAECALEQQVSRRQQPADAVVPCRLIQIQQGRSRIRECSRREHVHAAGPRVGGLRRRLSNDAN